VLTAAPVTPARAQGSIGISLADDGGERDDPRSTKYVVEQADPGERIERTIEIANDSSKTVTVDSYVGGAVVGGTGFDLDDGDDAEIVTWSRVAPATVELAAGARAEATVTISVPADTRPGERYGVVWAQVAGGDGRVVNRVGIRMFVLIGDGDSDLLVTAMTPYRDDQGRGAVDVEIQNIGERALDVSGTLRLDDDVHAEEPETAIGAAPTIAPGARGVATARFERGPPNGPWVATVELDANGDDYEATARFTFPPLENERGDAALATMVDEDGVPFVLVLLATTLIVAVVATSWRLRARS